MNDDTTDFEQVDEEILIFAVSDEALEAAAGTDKIPYNNITNSFIVWSDPCCRRGYS
jgi:hypothetical protein